MSFVLIVHSLSNLIEQYSLISRPLPTFHHFSSLPSLALTVQVMHGKLDKSVGTRLVLLSVLYTEASFCYCLKIEQ